MRKKIYCIISIISILCLISCIVLRSTYHNFSANNVKNNIKYLSSKKFEGRLTGSDANNKVTSEIKNLFKDYNLKPLSDDYLEPFTIKTPVYTNGSASIKIQNGDALIKELVPGVDFKEDMLNCKSSSVQITKDDKITIFPKSILVEKDDKKYIFYVTFDEGFPFRSSFIYDCPFEFAVQINTNTFKEILTSIRNGYTVNVYLPYVVEEKTVYNVVGKIEGSNDDLAPLIITAHFDHVGKDSLGNIYYGALDNASGICFLLELAHTYSTLKTPTRDIIFVALNAEEMGLIGSQNFASRYCKELKGASVINFDMIGADNTLITFMNGKNTDNENNELLNNLEAICVDNELGYLASNEDSSDHASFVEYGFNALTICHSDTSNIHTPRDTVDNISVNAISNVQKLTNQYIIDNCYSNFTLLIYSKYTLLFFTISSGALIIFYFIKYKKKES